MARKSNNCPSVNFYLAVFIAAIGTTIFCLIDKGMMGRWALLSDMVLFMAYFLYADLKSDDYGNR